MPLNWETGKAIGKTVWDHYWPQMKASNTMRGIAGGALLGAGYGMFSSSHRDSTLRSGLSGAIAGGLLGSSKGAIMLGAQAAGIGLNYLRGGSAWTGALESRGLYHLGGAMGRSVQSAWGARAQGWRGAGQVGYQSMLAEGQRAMGFMKGRYQGAKDWFGTQKAYYNQLRATYG